MITVIAGTNRLDSYTQKVAQLYYNKLTESCDEQVEYLSLHTIPLHFYENAEYSNEGQETALGEIQDKYIVPAGKFVIIIPEYNGTFPGVLKMFIDAISIRKYKPSFHGKKALLTGVSSGRAGNLRGMEHLTGILNYLQITIFPNRLPISTIEDMVDSEGEIADDDTLEAIDAQIKEFVGF